MLDGKRNVTITSPTNPSLQHLALTLSEAPMASPARLSAPHALLLQCLLASSKRV